MPESPSLETLQLKAEAIRESVIKMLERAGSGHSAGSLGQADIFTALYFAVMHHDPNRPDWPERDVLVQSNGHTCPVRYAAMAEAGYFPKEELLTLRQFGSRLQGHPERTKLPGLETTSGPLGEGLSQAAGMALAMRMDGQLHRRVYVTTGDGELDEGNNWEAIMLAAKYHLSNMTVIVDRNNIQIDGQTEVVMPLENLKDKWEAFGWRVMEIDGNNIQAVINACHEAQSVTEKPTVILAYTVPGMGVDFMEYDFHWHGIAPDHDQAKQALRELRTLRGKIKSEAD